MVYLSTPLKGKIQLITCFENLTFLKRNNSFSIVCPYKLIKGGRYFMINKAFKQRHN